MRILGSKIVGWLRKWLLGMRNTRASCSAHEVNSHLCTRCAPIHHLILSHRERFSEFLLLDSPRPTRNTSIGPIWLKALILITHVHCWIVRWSATYGYLNDFHSRVKLMCKMPTNVRDISTTFYSLLLPKLAFSIIKRLLWPGGRGSHYCLYGFRWNVFMNFLMKPYVNEVWVSRSHGELEATGLIRYGGRTKAVSSWWSNEDVTCRI